MANRRRSEIISDPQGAALVVAIAVLTILLAIAFTFFSVSRLELKTVTNVENTVRADLLTDGAINIAISFLSQDKHDHPTVTSLDHAWRTYFNGAWIQGKLWAFPEQWAEEQSTGRFAGLTGGNDVPTIFFTEEEGPQGSIPGGGGNGHLYYPRYETGRNPNNRPTIPGVADYFLDTTPFLIDPEGQREYDRTQSPPFFIRSEGRIPAAYQVSGWADIDNDGDGLRDSMWIPLVSDTLVGNAVDADTHEILVPGDGMDNNLDGIIDEPTETAVFLYYGGNDGLDNDNINRFSPTVDDAAENRWFLTAPINSLDAGNRFYIILRNVDIPGLGTVDINTDPSLPWPNRWVDVLDNDYDLVHNKHFEFYTPATAPPLPYDDSNPLYVQYMAQINDAKALLEQRRLAGQALPIQVLTNLPAPYDPPNDFDQRRGVGVPEISPRYLGDVANTWRVKSTGEPVCNIVGRAAILINDEASKVNVNVAGGITLEIPAITNPGNTGPTDVVGAGADPDHDYWMPATASAQSTSQYCTRVLPQIGTVLSRRLWNLLMGSPNGNGDEAEYVLDEMAPGYGLVDDNANALQLAMNGIDDNGNGMIDEGVNPAYPEYLGMFEGVDEPDEFQRLNPYRNLVAEGRIPESDGTTLDSLDNDNNGATNERGELGDKLLRTREEVKRAAGIGPATSDLLKNLITLHSTDKNNRFTGATASDSLLPPDPIREQADSRLVSSGLKVDYNYASASTIAQAFVSDWGLTSPTPRYAYDNSAEEAPALAFATGLQQEGVNVALEPPVQVGTEWFRSPIYFRHDTNGDGVADAPVLDPFDNLPIPYPADPQLRALQLATNIVDGRDTDYARTVETMQVNDTWWEGESATPQISGQQRKITYTVAGCEGIRITEMMVRPVRRVEAEMLKFLGPDSANPETGQTPYFCPNMFSQYALPQNIANPPNPFPFTEKPDFDMMRTYFEEMIPAQGSVVPSGYTGYWLQFADPDFRDNPNAKPVPPLQPPALPYPYWYRNSQILPNIGGGDGVIGSDSVLTTTRATIPVVVRQFEDGKVVNVRVEEWPNIIQFRFGPGPGLPPGKYYLTVNTTTAQVDPNTQRPYASVYDYKKDQIRFATKTGTASQDILSDVYSEYFSDPAKPNPISDFYSLSMFSQPYPSPTAPVVGYKGYLTFDPGSASPPALRENATGWAFLPGDASTFTVTIPPYAGTSDSQEYLYVAICPGKPSPWEVPEADYPGNPDHLVPNGVDDDHDGFPDDGPNDPAGRPEDEAVRRNGFDDDGDGEVDDGALVSINFFDFSQEPDHEWVEIENVTGHPVDISGWTLTVGGVDKEGNVVTKDRVDMRIPPYMTLDENRPENERSPVILESRPPNNRLILAVDMRENQGGANILMNNGMGLVGADLSSLTGSATWDLRGVSSPKPSTFNPWAWPERDYPGNPYGLTPNGIDDDGDGVPDDGPTDPAGSPEPVALQANGIDDDNDGFIDDTATSPGISPFDNMYAARRVVQVQIDGLTNAGAVTSVNDVAKWVLRGGVFPDYPERDGIDNDADNPILSYDGVNNPGDLPATLPAGFQPTLDKADDGVDEGGYRELTKFYLPNPGPSGGGFWVPMAAPGSFNFRNVRSDFEVLRDSANGLYQYYDYNNPADPLTWRNYLGYSEQPPEWKEFVERRLFPGDNVVVTLFAGPPERKQVVDRVTYTERDVINRAIDDDVPVEYNGVRLRHTLYETGVFTLDPNGDLSDVSMQKYITFWPDDTMMLDFYRTLERKYHPLYNGDRFGTSNRWEATDGNYDDWSHFPVALNSPNFNGTPLARNDAAIPLPAPSADPTTVNMNPQEADLADLNYAPIENFDGPQVSDRLASYWASTGSWGPAGGALVGTSGLIHYEGPPLPKLPYRSDDPQDAFRWKAYRFACDFKPLVFPTGSAVGFVFRYERGAENSIRYYRVDVTLGTDGLTHYTIIKHWGGAVTDGLVLLTRTGPLLPVGNQAPLLFEVKVEGDHIFAIVNGVVLETWDNKRLQMLLNDGHAYIPDGTVGFYCSGVQVAFDNVYVITRDKERDHPYTSPGDAATQPYVAFDRTFLYDTVTGEFSTSQQGIVNAGTPTEQRWGDWIVPARDVVSGSGEKAVEFPRGLRVGDSYPLDEDAIVSTAATDRVLLTCGQADFRLLWPDSTKWDKGMLEWDTTITPRLAPQVWRPVFSYSLGEKTLNYAYKVGNTSVSLSDIDSYHYLFNWLSAYQSIPSWVTPTGLLYRYGGNDKETPWQSDRRIMMYVSGNMSDFSTDASRPDPTASSRTANVDAAEALFEWDAEDGLENGQYDVYLDMGAYSDALHDSDAEVLGGGGIGLLTTLGRVLYGGLAPDDAGLFQATRPEELAVDVELFTDKDNNGQCWPNGASPAWNNLNRGAESFGQKQGLTPGLDGYIHYGVVRVENHYLALYLRNWAKYGRANRFLGLILTPRDRTSGRININTVETRAYRDSSTGPTRLFNALMGVPGVLFDEGQQYIAPDGAPTPPRLVDYPPFTEPAEGVLPPLPALPQIQIDPPQLSPATNLLDRARMIEVGRPGTRTPVEYAPFDYPHRRDGRYYASLPELLSYDSEFDYGVTPLHPLTIKLPYLVGSTSQQPDNPQWYDEIATRFGKMSNLITTRSDVFEIIVTVQAGYTVDDNHDGQINWRSDNEFIVTSEKKARSVYER